jgi:hypothetical protein
MRATYKVFAWLIALGVVVQAASMVYGVAGLGIWIDRDGGVLDKAAFESEELLFPELVGLMVHGMFGMIGMPALALLFLIISFFAKVPGGVLWAALVLVAVVLQVTLGLLGHEAAIWGGLHGINALVLFSLALYAGMRVPRAVAARAETSAEARETV